MYLLLAQLAEDVLGPPKVSSSPGSVTLRPRQLHWRDGSRFRSTPGRRLTVWEVRESVLLPDVSASSEEVQGHRHTGQGQAALLASAPGPRPRRGGAPRALTPRASRGSRARHTNQLKWGLHTFTPRPARYLKLVLLG